MRRQAFRELVKSGLVATNETAAGQAALRALTRRGMVPPRIYSQLAPASRFSVTVDKDAVFDYEAAEGDVVGRHLFWSGLSRWESETWREFIPLAREARGFADVGAFTGAYSLVAAAVNTDIRCVAFEPVPGVYERLTANVDLNEWSSRVTAVNAAVTDSLGPVQFFIPDRAMPDTGHLDSSKRVSGEAGTWHAVQGTRLANALPVGFNLDLMKIDVEDAEGPVVEAMADVLAAHRPTIVIELLASGSYQRAVEVLEGLGYSFRQLRDTGPVVVNRPKPIAGDPFMNFLCIP